MNFRVIIATRGCVKVLGSVLDAAVLAGHELDIVLRPRSFREPVLPADLERWPSVPCPEPDAVISVRVEDFRQDDPGLKVVVPLFAEFLLHDVADYDGMLLCYPSSELARRHYEGPRSSAHQTTGWTTADHANFYRRGLGPRDSHVFFSMKNDVPRPRRVPYLRIAMADRYLAHARGLRWIVKTRAKHKDPWWLRVLADEYVSELAMYPHTSQQLLARAVSMSHFTSGAVAEAVLHSVSTHWYRQAEHRQHLLPHQRQPDAYLQPWLMDRETYIRRFIGWDDGQNGQRVVDAIDWRVRR